MNYKELHNKFKNCSDDTERWKFVLEHKDIVEIRLDNDETYVIVKGIENDDIMNFAEFIGWEPGVWNLLEAIGIDAEGV